MGRRMSEEEANQRVADSLDRIAAKKEAKWSERQLDFMEKAEEQGFEVDCSYSGRGMYGTTCPCVRVSHLEEFDGYEDYSRDNMGLGYVIYCQ